MQQWKWIEPLKSASALVTSEEAQLGTSLGSYTSLKLQELLGRPCTDVNDIGAP